MLQSFVPAPLVDFVTCILFLSLYLLHLLCLPLLPSFALSVVVKLLLFYTGFQPREVDLYGMKHCREGKRFFWDL